MGILYGHRCILCGADFPVTTSRTLQLCPDCAAAVRREYRCNESSPSPEPTATIAPLYYRGTVQNAMKRFKFNSAALLRGLVRGANVRGPHVTVGRLAAGFDYLHADWIAALPQTRVQSGGAACKAGSQAAFPAVRGNTAQAMVCRQAIRAEGLRRAAEQRKRCRSAEGRAWI